MADRVPKKILLIPGNEEQKKANIYIQRFNDLNFSQHKTIDNNKDSIDRLLGEICNIKTRQINIAVDYSCMPKKWYAMFIDCITRNAYHAEHINLYLSYTPKIFEHNPGKRAIDYFGPIIFNRDNLKDRKPISMIVSLDHNGVSLNEAINKVKPQKLLAFVPNCSHDPEYSRIVREHNSNLLGRLDVKNVINYECDRPEEINSLLTSRCLDERINSEVVIVPQGPKTFSIMSMLLSVRYPDIKLWEIVFKDHKNSADHGDAAAKPVIVKVSFLNDELD
ncbi:MAG TPA: hypothetical protein VHI78_12265 [Bacteroidales bacterium]|nr:hypothetical protein [Bacteroidales bacterium]